MHFRKMLHFGNIHFKTKNVHIKRKKNNQSLGTKVQQQILALTFRVFPPKEILGNLLLCLNNLNDILKYCLYTNNRRLQLMIYARL